MQDKQITQNVKEQTAQGTRKKGNKETASEKQQIIDGVNRRVRKDRVLLNNPVIMQGLGIAPLIVAATSAENALVLMVAVTVLLTPTRILAALLCHIIPVRFKGAIYALCSAAVYIPAFFVVSYFFDTAQISQVGLYLPLLVIDPIVLKRYESATNESASKAIKKGFVTTVGYVLVLFTVGCVRELLGTGTIFGAVVFTMAPMPIALLPAGGFIVLAILMMIWRSCVNIIKNTMVSIQEERAI